MKNEPKDYEEKPDDDWEYLDKDDYVSIAKIYALVAVAAVCVYFFIA